jgi:hypothetical protein
MFAANTYRIRLADTGDTDTLRRLAEQSSAAPLTGRVLIGEVDCVGVAALSLSDGRVVADASPHVDYLVANLRVRAATMWAYEATPSLNDRLLGGLPVWYRATAVPTWDADEKGAERESVLAHS